jgi:arsenate reductase (thioredoxin)
MAEAFFRTLAGESFDAVSTAVQPNSIHPLTQDVMKEAGVDMSGQGSLSVAESLRENFTYVVTICDATRERHPIFPFATRLLHWSVADAGGTEGSSKQRLELLRSLRDRIKQRVSQFVAEMGQTREGTPSLSEQRTRAASANGTIQEDKKEPEG